MNPSIQREVEVFCAALELSDILQRRLFLDQACGDNFIFCARIESLLAMHVKAERFFEEAALAFETQIDR